MTDEPLLSVRNLKKHYPITEGILSKQVGAAKAVDGISFDIEEGETLGLVGESGCGKSTAASSIIRLEEATDGEVIFNGGGRQGRTRNQDGSHPNDITQFEDEELKAFRRDAQMIFQDPSSSLDPRMTVGSSVAEMLLVHGMTDKERRREIVEDLLERVGLEAEYYDRYPHEFSGGQKQRIALARALVLNPEFIVADEPVSALDVSIRAEILSLLNDIQEEFGLSMLFISHDMSVVREVCDRVAVMYLGEIVEIGDTEDVFSDPQHPYTEALLSAIPTPDPTLDRENIELKGTVPSPISPPSGCRFHTRCHKVIQSGEYDLEQSDWRALLTFRDKVQTGEIDPSSIRNALSGEDMDPSDVDDETVKTQLRVEFDLPETLSDRDAESTLQTAIDALAEGRIEDANEELSVFSTPCEKEEPAETDHGNGHLSSCLRNQSAAERAEPAPADD
ncbi:ABC transporter ATP-binding protein [Halolamina salifodinae]|uniref:Peptide/nickel transport system ATP-binding protein n=1 Tax=Halolamina salifodinae TaxID=1202767 RepID=A0A8T4GRH9_9EURY|nr:oligopeptide/dipeptide ABC transporter ATP-binding protein [Halolamina salifodinae]MBP1985647.1 peptide/nickel transport system ATP-binding protein [Halolamina salifodinae]